MELGGTQDASVGPAGECGPRRGFYTCIQSKPVPVVKHAPPVQTGMCHSVPPPEYSHLSGACLIPTVHFSKQLSQSLSPKPLASLHFSLLPDHSHLPP